MIPNFFKRLDALPLNSNGKVDRKSLPPLELDSLNKRDLVKPRTELEETLHTIWTDVLNQQYICIEDDFYDIGGHSLLAIKLIARVNDKLGLDLDNQFLFTHTTVAAMAEAIESDDINQVGSISVLLNKGEKGVLPLHLLHPIGGTVYCYMALNQYLDKKFPIYAYQSPGIKDADEVEVGIEEIASRYVDEILTQQSEGPFQLGGWCFGGVLAYEVAHQLKQKGHTVLGIHVFDTRAPIVANHPDDGDDATLLSWFARDLAVPHNKKLDLPPELLRTIDVEEQFQFVLDKARAIGVVEETTDVVELHNFFQIYIANGMSLQMYGEHSYDINVTLYRADSEPEDYGELLGWDQLIADKLAVTDIPGDHNSIMYKPNVEVIAAELNQRLSQQKQWINEVS
jgi:thioesterase domain-containing protein/acyl carrier protein